MNPNGKAPVLEIEPGKHAARIERDPLLSRGRDAAAARDDRLARARVLQWLFFEQYSHEPYIAVARFLRKFHPDPDIAARARREQDARRLSRARSDGEARSQPTPSSSAGATASPTSRSTPTRTSRTRAASSCALFPRFAPGYRACRQQPGYVGMPADSAALTGAGAQSSTPRGSASRAA